jgi:hypothetical protein
MKLRTILAYVTIKGEQHVVTVTLADDNGNRKDIPEVQVNVHGEYHVAKDITLSYSR